MSLDLIKIIGYVLGGLSIALAAIAVILFFNLKIVDAIKELNGVVATDTKKSSVKAINGRQASVATVAQEEVEDEDGIDKTVALVADENTYANFKILKNIIYVNTAEVIS